MQIGGQERKLLQHVRRTALSTSVKPRDIVPGTVGTWLAMGLLRLRNKILYNLGKGARDYTYLTAPEKCGRTQPIYNTGLIGQSGYLVVPPSSPGKLQP